METLHMMEPADLIALPNLTKPTKLQLIRAQHEHLDG
jgi:hypothetical protein